MIASPDPGCAVWRGNEGVDLDGRQERHDGPVGAFVGDREDALDDGGVGGFSVGREAEHRADRGESGVAGPDRVVPFVFEVVQERGDQRGVEIGEVEL